jgi:hypothetical protein
MPCHKETIKKKQKHKKATKTMNKTDTKKIIKKLNKAETKIGIKINSMMMNK